VIEHRGNAAKDPRRCDQALTAKGESKNRR
jgi:hypothetical protein